MALPSPDELFNRIDDRAGGVVQTLKRRWKLRLRYLVHRRHLHATADGLDRCGLAYAAQVDPFLLLRPLRSYLWAGLGPADRARHLVAHCHWASRQLPCSALHDLYRGGRLSVLSWPLAAPEGVTRVMTVDLQPGRDLGREGGMELHLRLDGHPVMRASFSILPAAALGGAGSGPQHVMVIGSLQGSEGGADLVRELTQLTQRIRPRHLMLTLLQGLAAGWGLQGLYGVARGAHVYARYRGLAQRVGVDYDEMWADLGATESVGTHWQLPLTSPARPESEVPSRKRAEHRRRTALRQQILDACAQAAGRGFVAEGSDSPRLVPPVAAPVEAAMPALLNAA